MSIHAHLLVDVAMQERDYHDALVLRRYLETFNRIDNHLVEAELPRLDAYIATLDGYYEYLEQRNRKRVCHKSMAHPLLCYLLYNPRSIVAYSKKGII